MNVDDVSELQELKREVAELRTDVRDLVDAWRTAQGMVRFVKWLGGTATAATAIWALIKLSLGASR